MPRLLAFLSLLSCLLVPAAHAGGDMSRGEYIYKLSGCENCHTDREHGGARLAGGRRLSTPLGDFYTPNISPDKATGLGNWSEADFRRALREGKNPAGQHYYPSFPYTSYTRLSDADIGELWRYLRQQPAVKHANQAHDLPWYLCYRGLLTFWKWLYFDAGAFQPETAKSADWNRGAYLVRGPGHCAECHTPRNPLGGFRSTLALAGTETGPEGGVVPNITPHKQYGIGNWKVGDITQYLESGIRADGDCAGSLMAEVIDNGLKYLSPEDRRGIATYLLDQPAVANPIHRAKKAKKKADQDY